MAFSDAQIRAAMKDPGASGPGGVYNQIRASMASSPAPASGGGGGGGGSTPASVQGAPQGPAPNPYGGQQGTWSTVNGPRTVPQMAQELAQVGYNGPTDPGSILMVYQRTTGGSVSAGGDTNAPAAGNATVATGEQGFNAEAARLAAQLADNSAQQAYLRGRLNLDTDIEARNKAQQAWQNTFDQAKFDWQKQQDTAGLTGTFNGAPTLAAQAEQNKTSLGYLGLLSNLKGPQDYGSYLRTLGSTPGGLRDLVASAAGKYVPAAGATTGVAPQAASLGGLVNAAATGQSGGTNYADYMGAASGLPAPNQISPDAWNNYTTSQKQLLLGMYGQKGYDVNDVADLYNQSLPKYAYSGGAAGAVKL